MNLPLLGPSIYDQTPTSFREHVVALHRAPERKNRAPKAPRPPKLKCKLVARALKKTPHAGRLEITLGSARTELAWNLGKIVGLSNLVSAANELKCDLTTLEGFLCEKGYVRS